MRLLTLLAVMVLPITALAQTMPPMHTEKNSNVTMVSPGPGSFECLIWC